MIAATTIDVDLIAKLQHCFWLQL